MFERTKTIWRQMLCRPHAESTLCFDERVDERRSSTRFPAQVETSFKPAGALDNTRLSGRIRNISLGGMNLLAKRPFEPGDMITVELPAAEQSNGRQVLACVVHCASEGSGDWSLGCTFSRELKIDDLQTVGAKPERHEENDQRESQRYACSIAATYQLVATEDQTWHRAQMLNLSASGVGLLVDHPVETGALLSVDLSKANGAIEKTILACVVHTARQPQEKWALGCNFIRSLSEEDLKMLL